MQRPLVSGRERSIFKSVLSILWRWGRFRPRRIVFLIRIAWRLWRASRRRVKNQSTINGLIPSVLAISPTMRCNYNCSGCYSRGRCEDEELTTDELNHLLSEAETLGVAVVVITGGEPLLRDDLLDLMECHPKLLFVFITNGSLINSNMAERISRSSNIVPVISIEGFMSDTDERRHVGAHATAIHAFEYLRDAKAKYGFSTMTTKANMNNLGTEAFVDQMVAFGCVFGVFIEYVPCGLSPRHDWVLDEVSRVALYKKVLELQRNKPIVLGQFPYDEYGRDSLCKGSGKVSLHINAQGGIEPCPFISLSCENIREGGFLTACQSQFLHNIRERTNLLRRQQYACSLFEHSKELESLHSALKIAKTYEHDN